jgi:triacylglycerol lipase
MTNIIDLPLYEKALLFAKLSKYAYYNSKAVKEQVKKLGFTTIKFFDKEGAQAYIFQSKTDVVVACRGTQPTEFSDIEADLKAYPVIAETVSRVHNGFKTEVDELWPKIIEDLSKPAVKKKHLWFCGHSLGAAMAVIMSARCMHAPHAGVPIELFTYGCPRVGWPGYCNSLGVAHHRWVNNNDVVTRVPPTFLGYRHHGTEHYLNTWGNIRTLHGWQRAKDRFRGMWRGIKHGRIDNFADHGIDQYEMHLIKAAKGIETPQT